MATTIADNAYYLQDLSVETLRRRRVNAQLYTSLAADRCIPRDSPERVLLLAMDDIARHTIASFAAGVYGGETASFPSIPGFLGTAFGQSVLHPVPNSNITGHKRQKEAETNTSERLQKLIKR